MKVQINHTILELVKGDITALDTDAIVNAANEHLAHGGGVAGVISRQGGPTIQQESNEWVRQHGRVGTGSAAITSGGRNPSRPCASCSAISRFCGALSREAVCLTISFPQQPVTSTL